MPYTKELPEWNAGGIKPPQSKLDAGWQVDEKPPASWWNWYMHTAYQSLLELQQNAVHNEKLGVNSGVATLGSDGKLTATQLPAIGTGQITDGSITNNDLATDVKVGSLASLTTTAKGSVTAAVNDVKSILDAHIGDNTRHLTAAERTKWNGAQLVKLTQDNGDATKITDFNSATDPGHYYTAGVTPNNPTGTGIDVYYAVLVMKQGAESTQLAHNKNTGRLYIRYKVYTGTWTAWVELATTAVATTSSNGLMSSTDKTALDGAQKWKLTGNDGRGVFPANGTHFDNVVETGFYRYSNDLSHSGQPEVQNYWQVEVMNFDGTNVTQRWTALFVPVVYIRRRSNSGWQPFRKLSDTNQIGSVLLGNKLVDTQTANFVGKVAGSTAANPHSMRVPAKTFLVSPNDGSLVEYGPVYQRIDKLDGLVEATMYSTTGGYAQHLFSFDLIAHVERTYGMIPGATTADKVAWLKLNVKTLTANWYGFGTSAGGNKATFSQWYAGNGTPAWGNNATHTSTSSARLSQIIGVTHIDSNGFIHLLAYADASNGTTPSVINTDYVELQVELSTSLKDNMKPVWIDATLQNGWVEFNSSFKPQYSLGFDGFVTLKGGVKLGTLETVIMTLPAGFRPTKSSYFIVSGEVSNKSIFMVTVRNDGQVSVFHFAGTNTNVFVSLDSIRFPTN